MFRLQDAIARIRALPEDRHDGVVDFWRKTGEKGEYCRPVGEEDFENS